MQGTLDAASTAPWYLIDSSTREAGSLDVALGHSPSGATDEGLNDEEVCSIVGTDLVSETWAIGAKKKHYVGVMAKLDGVTQRAEPEDRPGGKGEC